MNRKISLRLALKPTHARSRAHFASPRVQPFVQAKKLARVLVVFAKLLDHVPAHVRVVLFDLLGDAQRVLGRNARLATLAQELLNERGNVATGDGNVTNS